MVDSINWNIDLNTVNPFTNEAVTEADLANLDLDGNGNLDKDEWLLSSYNTQGRDNDGDVKIGEGKDTFIEALKDAGIPLNVSGEKEFDAAMSDVLDEFIELFFTENKGLTSEEKAAAKELINSVFKDFTKDYKKTHSGNFNIAAAAIEFGAAVKKKMAANEETRKTNDATISGYVDNVDTNLLSLFDLTIAANENGNISKTEFNQMKAAAVKYLMGMLLSDNFDDSLLKNLNPNYNSANSKFTKAKKAIEALKNETDPAKIQQLLTDAQTYLNEFIESCGRDKLAEAVSDTQQAKIEDGMKQILDKYIDEYKEQVITADMPEETKAYLEKFLQNCEAKFIAKIFEADEAETYTDKALLNQFASYIQQQLNQLAEIQTRAIESASEITSAYDSLVAISDNAKANGNISEEEKAALVDAGATLVMNQLMAGLREISFLEKLNPSYQSTSEFKEVKKLLDTLATSVDPDEIKDLQAKAEELIKTLISKCTGEQIVNAVDSLKPVEVSELTKDKAVYNSTISEDYVAGVSRKGKWGKQNEDSLKEIQEMAKADLEAYAESLKAQLKTELGEAYNEADVQKYINDAITDTIGLFTQNIERKNQHGNYTTKSDKQAFVFARRSGTKKGRYVYNVKALVDTFVEMFNKTSKEKQPARLDPSLATYDRETVVTEALGNDYWRNTTQTQKSKSQNEADFAVLIERAKQDLRKVGEALKANLKAEGLNIPDSVVDSYIDDCIFDTIKQMKDAFQVCNANGKNTGGNIGLMSGGAAAGVGTGLLASATFGTGALTTLGLKAGLLTAKTVIINGTAKTVAVASSAVPVVGWCVAGVAAALGVLGMTTNIFGATWGKHTADAGFFYEKKSHSKTGQFGYDTQTLVNVFLNNMDKKIAKWKQKEKEKKTTSEQIS